MEKNLEIRSCSFDRDAFHHFDQIRADDCPTIWYAEQYQALKLSILALKLNGDRVATMAVRVRHVGTVKQYQIVALGSDQPETCRLFYPLVLDRAKANQCTEITFDTENPALVALMARLSGSKRFSLVWGV